RAVVVAAHPQDATLGASGVLQRLHEHGTSVELVVATDGAGRCDRRAVGESLLAQGLPDVRVRWLGLSDAALADHHDDLVALLAEPLADADVCLGPWPDDPHSDHRVVGEATGRAAPVTTHRWSYPIWLWHRLHPDDPVVPRDRAFVHRLTESQRRRKTAGIAAFAGRFEAGPILDTEILFRQPPTRTAPLARFTDLYAATTDPWGTATKWYERRKRAVALAALPCERYGFAVEPACGTGVLTRMLADRCDRVLAFDPVTEAVRQARAATSGLPRVEIRQAELPAGLPAGPVDLVVFSEILYYLDDRDLRDTVDRAVTALRPGGHVLAVHWRPWAAEAPRDGIAAHRVLLARPEFEVVVDHRDEDFVLHVAVRR
ncbi:MAG TPA: bifunctional PIG-L family deacetylase/class I SAM-dependent methyltransferase, partial [Pseudonocardiaceae bacterium]|nr:bifunctional PIG-L family deacetylase/class I SAM-dependent methyltransferase [Pseudonocardiaceae bacterium]